MPGRPPEKLDLLRCLVTGEQRVWHHTDTTDPGLATGSGFATNPTQDSSKGGVVVVVLVCFGFCFFPHSGPQLAYL